MPTFFVFLIGVLVFLPAHSSTAQEKITRSPEQLRGEDHARTRVVGLAAL